MKFLYVIAIFLVILSLALTSQRFSRKKKVETCKLQPVPFALRPIEVTSYQFQEDFTVAELDPSTGARCLDGTNYKFLYAKGTGKGSRKFLFEFEGGGFCGVEGIPFLDSCKGRSQGGFGGSSRNMPGDGSSFSIKGMPLSFSSSNKVDNPKFYNWNRIRVIYCDGANHQGYKEQPVEYQGIKMYFRGYKNVMGVIDFARKKLGFDAAREVIISGESAGAQATFQWANYLRTLLPNKVKLSAIADSGLFLDVYNKVHGCHYLRFLMQNLVENTDSQKLPLFANCPYKYEVWKCMLPQYLIDSINIPMFVANSLTDNSALYTQAGVSCLTTPQKCTAEEISIISDYKSKILEIVGKIKRSKPQWGLWIRGCYEHVHGVTWGWYGQQNNVEAPEKTEGISYRDAVSQWFINGKKNKKDVKYVDSKDYTSNSRCKNYLLQGPLPSGPPDLPKMKAIHSHYRGYA